MTVFRELPAAVDWALDRLVITEGQATALSTMPSVAAMPTVPTMPTIAVADEGCVSLRPHRAMIVGRVRWLAFSQRIDRQDAVPPLAGLGGVSAVVPAFERLQGDAVALFRATQGSARALALLADELHVAAHRLLAFDASLAWSLIGVLGPSRDESSVFAGLRGTGSAAFASVSDPLVVKLALDTPLMVAPAALIGWFGQAVLEFDRVQGSWQCTGEGAAIIDPELPTVDSGRVN